MADSIQNRRNQQTYLRQVQQEKSQRKRDLMKAQNEDIKSVRDYYTAQSKQVDEDTAAAVSHIKEESRQLAEAERQEREERAAQIAEQKRLDREQMKAENSSGSGAYQSSVKKNSRA